MHTEARLIPNRDSDGLMLFMMNMEDYPMKHLLSCEFNIDTACVELKYSDGSMIAIYTPAVEDEVADNMYERSELDYLIYNSPLEYAHLVLSGDLERYVNGISEHGLID